MDRRDRVQWALLYAFQAATSAALAALYGHDGRRLPMVLWGITAVLNLVTAAGTATGWRWPWRRAAGQATKAGGAR